MESCAQIVTQTMQDFPPSNLQLQINAQQKYITELETIIRLKDEEIQRWHRAYLTERKAHHGV
jgi:hypothetical protein